ncbi:hypothetical protein [Mucilaginibacter lappiensis]|uniref:Uncharacterized protein n=1 Tax=Mucilaginibacter lappiensis TaxID=354630 RepID=A0A1N6PG75_9SPHI|nr:hypothetical protein [Mucilaginibacter lappiensis]MBB6107598.1 hypothetical protein [Mucilaginibacter lappiensis]MBB6126082.1 hypothetical protein [Mucilaginibacter lappiensis]SIQ03252.1 hypothetical protein SAMN05421821_101482 [Mucilaginibacter lappiensis]
MRSLLTPKLLQFLINQGYRYCLSKTTCIFGPDANVCIILTPVKYIPVLRRLPEKYDTYFKITEEPVQMADGIDETLIIVDLSTVKVEHSSEV